MDRYELRIGEGKPLDIGSDFKIELRRVSDIGHSTDWVNIMTALPLPPLDDNLLADSDQTNLTDPNGENLTDE